MNRLYFPVYSSVDVELRYASRLDVNLILSSEELKSYVCVESSKPCPPYSEISRALRRSKMNLVIKTEARLESRSRLRGERGEWFGGMGSWVNMI